ncbi:putative nucleoside-diphosphate-sugar epimerase protein [Botryosphaeria dothidea]|uniref:Nucleoside-diphosphate-sugar epimerase protein n=1 Tax=Botryosphaeria dothidea TaxID=55169 RepID=A0A8H4IRD7_9PEZI|nr:putative nucleoside-diphosphate-sugar epimerase protein [Botryosphaeria dothidea]
MAPTPKKTAFVTGANGISGNAIVEHLIREPKPEWERIIITSRTPTKTHWQDPRVEFVAIDFLAPLEEVIQAMESHCSGVTHAYFTSYVHIDNFKLLAETNIPLFENFLNAIDAVAGDSLQRVCLQTGGKYYGVHLGPVRAPLVEDEPRYEDHGLNFYYKQEDCLKEMSKRRSWSYNIIRPNAIVGYTPGKNGMSEAVTLALYMLVCKEIGQKARFSGNRYFWHCVDDSSYAPSLADMSVWATTEEHTKNEAFNHQNGDVFFWKNLLPKLGDYYGVEVLGENAIESAGDSEVMEQSFKMGNWAKDKKPVWESICKKYGGNPEAFDWGTWWFMDWAVGKSWPTISSVNKARKMGWQRYDDTYETWIETFRSFENAGILPRPQRGVKRSYAAANGTNGANGVH